MICEMHQWMGSCVEGLSQHESSQSPNLHPVSHSESPSGFPFSPSVGFSVGPRLFGGVVRRCPSIHRLPSRGASCLKYPFIDASRGAPSTCLLSTAPPLTAPRGAQQVEGDGAEVAAQREGASERRSIVGSKGNRRERGQETRAGFVGSSDWSGQSPA